jgi:hypothetical protein
MRFLRRTAGYTPLGPQKKLRYFNRITNVADNRIYISVQKNWKEHVDRMSSDRIPKLILKYQPKWKRKLGRPLKR